MPRRGDDGGRDTRPRWKDRLDPILDLLYGCGSSQNVNGYCNPEVDKLIEQQSIEADPGRRKQLVWPIERKLAEDGARPIIFYSRRGTCWHPRVKGLTIMVKSLFNGNRMEDVIALAHGKCAFIPSSGCPR
jgi:ABC-type transport system substrate-binding protein